MQARPSRGPGGMRRFKKKAKIRLLRFIASRRIEKYAILLACCIIALLIYKADILQRFELALFDYRFQAQKARSVLSDIVLIDMGSDSVDYIGRWPWPRRWHATLITALNRERTSAILYDVLFCEPSDAQDDMLLKTSIKTAGNVYLPYAYKIETLHSDNPVTDNSIYGIDRSMDSLEAVAKGQGFINISPDIDGVIRRAPLVIEYAGQRRLQISLKLVCDMLGIKEGEIIIVKGRYIRLPLKRTGRYLDIPIDDNYQMLINYPGRWKESFAHFSFIDVIRSSGLLPSGEEAVVPAGVLKDKICIVGMGVSGLIDVKPTPLEPLYPAMGINACIIDNILRSDFLRQVPDQHLVWVIIGLVFIAGSCISIYHPLRDFILTAIILVSYNILAIIIFSKAGVWLNMIYPSTAVLVTYISLTLYNEVHINIEKKRFYELATTDGLTGLYQKRHFNALMRSAFTDRRRNPQKAGKLSLMMADIDHFKNINDTYGHQFGDHVLKKIAQAIRSTCRPLDICARYGGEEFIIMLPDTKLSEAMAIAERIRKIVEKKRLRHHGKICRATLSIGVSCMFEDEQEDSLISRADGALYCAKHEGRNKVCSG